METLMDHSWPGNVRELQNVIERAVILCSEGGELEPIHLGIGKVDKESANSTTGVESSLPTTSENGQFLTLSEVEKHHILAALKKCKGNRTHAAKMLSISIRTLRNKLNEYNLKSGNDTGSPEDAAA